MYLHNITRGTGFEITLEDGREFHGAYDGNIDHMNFYMLCPEIVRNIETLTDSKVSVKFNGGKSDYTFTAQIMGKSARSDALHETSDFKILTAFKELPRRESFRIEITLQVKIHHYEDDFRRLYTGDWICDAVSADVSKNGIRLWADHTLSEDLEAMYTLEFSLRTGWIYLIPARLSRHERNLVTRSYHYDYGFIFDFTNMPEKREKLFLDVMAAKLRGKA